MNPANELIQGVVNVALAIVGIAIIAVLVSRQANTAGVITAASRGLGSAIGSAVSPVTGGTAFGSAGVGYLDTSSPFYG